MYDLLRIFMKSTELSMGRLAASLVGYTTLNEILSTGDIKGINSKVNVYIQP